MLNKFIHKLLKVIPGGSSAGLALDDTPGVKGVVKVHAYDRNGRTVARHTGANLLMYNERDILIELLGNLMAGDEHYGTTQGLTPTGNRRWLKWFCLGEGSVAPTRSDAGLTSGLATDPVHAPHANHGNLMLDISSPLVTVSKNANALQYSVTVPFTDGGGGVDTRLNGRAISEVGLWTIAPDYDNSNFYSAPTGVVPTQSEVLFSRQVHPTINKTNQIQIEYTYSIYFT